MFSTFKEFALVTAVASMALIAAPFRVPLLSGSVQTAPGSPPASITGMVVRGGSGEPIARAQVTITRAGAGPQQQQESFESSVLTTDAQGIFHLTGLPAGAYRIIAARNGYLRQEYGQRSLRGAGTPVNVRPGEQVRDIVFRLTAAATISGRVIDEASGEPLPGITVQALRATYDAGGNRTLQPAATARTNDLGEYRLYWINPGYYYLRADPARTSLDAFNSIISPATMPSPNETVNSGLLPAFYPGTPDASRAVLVHLQPGVESRADFSLPRGGRFRILGKVLDAATGLPPQNATISLSVRGASGVSSALDAMMGPVGGMLQGNRYSPATGEFELRDVMAGAYWLQALSHSQPAMIPTGPQGAPAPPNFLELLKVAQIPLDVSTDLENLMLTVNTGVILRGRIAMDAPVRAGPSVFASASLELRSLNGGPSILSVLAGQATPSADGTFSLRAAPGEYKLVVNGLGENIYIKDVRLGRMDALQAVTVDDGLDGTLEITLAETASRISGTVIDRGLKPLPGVQAVLVPERERFRQDLFKTATTDQEGRFLLRGIAPGNYRLFAWEDMEPYSYFDPEILSAYEPLGRVVQINESSQEVVELQIIPANR